LNDEEIVCEDLALALSDLYARGFRLELVYPAEEPNTAVLAKGSARVRVTSRPGLAPPSRSLPRFEPCFVITRAGGDPGKGRAGMLYRDLIPTRLGGRYIASHISIPVGGLVDDWVHFHQIALQIIYVASGWVRLVYEDQGEPFVMHEGDLVLQPPEIRHKVLESSDGLQVIEISAPALHATFADHVLDLPNGNNPERVFGRQKFLHHVASKMGASGQGSIQVEETGAGSSSAGLVDVRIFGVGDGSRIDFPPHDGELSFGFVIAGDALLEIPGGSRLDEGDAFVVPPVDSWAVSAPSPDFRLLHVTTAHLD
jgi:quercetin dioxygenase-like cupin family protein